ncbi:MAG: Fic family protein, partial [Nitrospinota bacterium]
MKIPMTPPDIHKVTGQLLSKSTKEYIEIIDASKPTDSKGRYLHWDKLRHKTPPEGFSPEEWWVGIKWARRSLYKRIRLLRDKKNEPFTFAIPDCVQRDLHFLDINTAGKMSMEAPIVNPHMKNTYLIRSFIDEAINSSQLEGAVTTRNVAKEMLRVGRKPKDESEQMIFNNYLAMQFIRDLKGESLTPSIV